MNRLYTQMGPIRCGTAAVLLEHDVRVLEAWVIGSTYRYIAELTLLGMASIDDGSLIRIVDPIVILSNINVFKRHWAFCQAGNKPLVRFIPMRLGLDLTGRVQQVPPSRVYRC